MGSCASKQQTASPADSTTREEPALALGSLACRLTDKHPSLPGELKNGRAIYDLPANSYLGWRTAAVSSAAPTPALADSMAELNAKLEEYLSQDGTPHQNTTLSTWDVEAMLDGEADWTRLTTMQLDKVRAINALGGPRMKVVWTGTLSQIGRIPRYPQDAEHILDAEVLLETYVQQMDAKGKAECVNADGELEQRILCVSMFSHRWERPHNDPALAFPDSATNKKARALAHYGRVGLCPEFAQHRWDYYLWIDYAGINQDDYHEKMLGITMLPGYISCAIEMIYYDSTTAGYEKRAWTRLERVLGFAYTWSPAFVHMDDDYPQYPCHGERMRALVERHDPGLFCVNPEQGTLSMTVMDPLSPDAGITDARDQVYIEKMCGIVKRTRTLNPAFKSDLDSEDGALVLGKSTMPVDTLSAAVDQEARMRRQREASERKTLGKTMLKRTSTGRLGIATVEVAAVDDDATTATRV